MTRSVGVSLAVCLAAGSSVALGDEPLVALEPTVGKVVDVAHIYFNIATGEKVVTLLADGQGQTAPALSLSVPVWSSTVGNQCAEYGFTDSFFFALDDNTPNSTGVVTSLATAITLSDYGDVPVDTVVDMVHINWVTAHPDVDINSDSQADGLTGLGGQWTYWDLDNGRENCIRLPLVSFALLDLPGHLDGGGEFSAYSVDIDLAGAFSSSLTFEIGDSDGDLQGASYANNDVDTDFDGIGDGISVGSPGLDMNFDGMDDADLDGDGLFDWGWTVRFYQPGTDSDGDGIPDGDPADSMHPIGVSFGAPAGVSIDHGDGTWSWDIDMSIPDPGTGQEDRFAMYGPANVNGDLSYAGGFWFGGFSCEVNDTGNYTPSAMFEHQLIGASSVVCCCQDFNGDGELNFFDISAFLAAFSAMEPDADFNGDDAFNFFDISEYLAAFAAGCP